MERYGTRQLTKKEKKTLRTESTNDFSSFHFLVTRGVQRNFFII